jgi:hypothetical protein
MGDQPVARPLPTNRTTQTQNKGKQPSMPSVGLEPTIPAFEREKTVYALDRTATVIVFPSFIDTPTINHKFFKTFSRFEIKPRNDKKRLFKKLGSSCLLPENVEEYEQ